MLYTIRKGNQLPTHLLTAIATIEWPAGAFVAEVLDQQKMADEDYYFILSKDGNRQDDLVAFVAYVEKDIIADPKYSPCLATLYVDPAYRKRGLSRNLVHLVEAHAKAQNQRILYINTQHQGLYEPLGYDLLSTQLDNKGRTIYVYQKNLF